VATRLHDAGYTTGLFGKYLNGYDGTTRHFGTSESDYSTDVLNAQVKEFIGANAAQDKPFFAYVAPNAPHGPSTPAPPDQHTFDGVQAPRLPSFNERGVSDKPPWIQSLRVLTSTDLANIDQRHENRVESLQAVDDLVADVVRKLGEQGVLSNTYIVFTSDNGFHHGEHRIRYGKGRPYEESIRVPLVIRGPAAQPPAAGQPRLSTDKLTLNTDYLPTFMDLAGAQTPPYVEGRSLLSVLTGSATTWRTAILIEGRKCSSDPEIPVDLNYNGIRTRTRKYIEYEGGFSELYNLTFALIPTSCPTPTTMRTPPWRHAPSVRRGWTL